MTILGCSLGFVLLLECVALLLGELGMALTCRLFITGMLAAAYHLKCRMNQEVLARRTQHVLRGHNALLLLFCMVTLFFHVLFGRAHFRVYSLVICLLSLLCLAEEYLCIMWLWQIELQRTDALQIEVSDVPPRKSLYAQLYHTVVNKLSFI